MNRFLIVPRLKIHNANALSSPYTIGFPAMTAWLGGVHALQRKLNAGPFAELRFTACAVSCHQIDLQTYRGRGDYVHSIVGTGNPLDKTGERPSFIEEARCHLNVTLAIEYQGVGMGDTDAFLAAVQQQLTTMKLAGGDILSFKKPELLKIDGDIELGRLTRKLMPGYVLLDRRELMAQAMQDGQDAIDTMLDYLTVHHRSQIDVDGQVTWTAERKTKGWIVPFAIGFHGVSELGFAEHQRDPNIPHRFAESLVTLGEFVMPYRLKFLDDLLWRSRYDADNNCYLIEQHPRNA
ncbi:MAG: type I-F CRISPR-associated protein Csy2 [Methylomonas sp.]|nr:MAG: type I-F CRISPR-associated protein Csy2 [Methylomonas sp.]